MDILILGGTGTIGSQIQKILLNTSSNHLYISSRKKQISSGQTTYICGNPHDLGFVKKILERKWDCIIDLMIYSIEELKERSELYLSATKQYIYISSARVYADSSSPLHEESDRLLEVCSDKIYLATNEYALEKAREEDIFVNSSNRNWTIIRPYITYGERKYQLGCFEKEEWLYRVLHGRSLVFSKDILQKKTAMTYSKDVAKGICNIVGKKEALHNIFQIASNKTYTWGEIIETYRKVLVAISGQQLHVKYVSDGTSIIRKSSEYQLTYDRMYNRIFDSTKINSFGNLEYTELEAGLRECLEEFLEAPSFGEINWKMEAKKDRIAGERTSIKEFNGVKNAIKYYVYRYFFGEREK